MLSMKLEKVLKEDSEQGKALRGYTSSQVHGSVARRCRDFHWDRGLYKCFGRSPINANLFVWVFCDALVQPFRSFVLQIFHNLTPPWELPQGMNSVRQLEDGGYTQRFSIDLSNRRIPRNIHENVELRQKTLHDMTNSELAIDTQSPDPHPPDVHCLRTNCKGFEDIRP